MSVVSVSVPVPTSGDGPRGSILPTWSAPSDGTGQFSSRAVTCSLHEDIVWGCSYLCCSSTPVAKPGVAQTLPETPVVTLGWSSRSIPSGRLDPVTMVVNAVKREIEQNFFATLRDLVPGSFENSNLLSTPTP